MKANSKIKSEAAATAAVVKIRRAAVDTAILSNFKIISAIDAATGEYYKIILSIDAVIPSNCKVIQSIDGVTAEDYKVILSIDAVIPSNCKVIQSIDRATAEDYKVILSVDAVIPSIDSVIPKCCFLIKTAQKEQKTFLRDNLLNYYNN